MDEMSRMLTSYACSRHTSHTHPPTPTLVAGALSAHSAALVRVNVFDLLHECALCRRCEITKLSFLSTITNDSQRFL